ncbi:MAG: AAC(3) family N-acetyltransferase [Lachnospiraceae bacterium]|nr:AAC(3) family N-acetyltransferase [Lachnospiraceae bacterium]
MDSWFNEFKEKLTECKIGVGDIVYISSDITMMLCWASKNLNVQTIEERDIFLNQFVNTLQKQVGEIGTLLIPVFTWAFCREGKYDARSTQGEVGMLGNWILSKRKDFIRTRHPIYSFMVWGKDAGLLYDMKNVDSWGENSPFAYLHHNKGKNLLFNTTLSRSFTFLHYVEQSVHVPYRYMKTFCGQYTDWNGNCSQAAYSTYVRDLDIQSRECAKDDCLDDGETAIMICFGVNTLRVVDLEKSYEVIKCNILENGANMWYSFDNYVIDWTVGNTHADELLY